MTSEISFSTRAQRADGNSLKLYLLELMTIKKTNLCVSADVNSTSSLLRLAEEVGDYICVLKTHADIVDDFGERAIKGLREISQRKKFLIFEDRKFGDIGSTVQAQYARGPQAIATWAHIVNAHIFPGPAIITALKATAQSSVESLRHGVSTEIFVGTPHISSEGEDDDYIEGKHVTRQSKSTSGRKDSIVTNTTIYQTVELSQQRSGSEVSSPGPRADNEELEQLGEPPVARALLLLAQMSSEGNLMDVEYTKRCVMAAREHRDFILGFVSQQDLNQEGTDDNFLSMTPGVKLPPVGRDEKTSRGDGLGQRYRTPQEVMGKHGCDIIIVGRGITAAKDKAKEAERYRDAGWKAYESRISGV